MFGTENILKYKDGSFLDEIWRKLGRPQRQKRNGGLDIHEMATLQQDLAELGEDQCEDILNEPDDVVGTLMRTAEEVRKVPSEDSTANNLPQHDDGDVVDDVDQEDFQIDVQAVNHADLFRNDRGRAAIEEGEDGFDEEMGGNTQNMFRLYERGGMSAAENPQGGDDGDGDGASTNSADDERQADGIAQPNMNQHGRFELERNVVPMRIPQQAGAYYEAQPTNRSADTSTRDNSAVLRREIYVRVAPPRGSLPLPRAPPRPLNIQLVGHVSGEIARNAGSTTFSAADLPLPTYGSRKSKNKRNN